MLAFRRLAAAIGDWLFAHRLALSAIVVLSIAFVVSLIISPGFPITAEGESDPTTVASPSPASDATRLEWTLLDLQRYLERGDVVAISVPKAGPVMAYTPAAQYLIAQLTDGREAMVRTDIKAAEAAATLRALGYGPLLEISGEEVEAEEPASDDREAAGGFDIGLFGGTLLVLALVAVIIWHSRRSNPPASKGKVKPRNEQSGHFTTLRPALAGTDEGESPTADAADVDVAVAEPAPIDVRFDDVAGCEEAKLELTETIEFLRNPERFRRLGAKIPRGVMLYGPPGTGKTMLAKAAANEAGVAFIFASASAFVEKYVGVGASRMRELFEGARAEKRAIIFIDEFDAVGRTRGGHNSHEEREQTLNELLVQMDGFATTDEIVVIAATNRDDILDPAVLRPGRFTRKVHVPLPDVEGRRLILEVHAANKPMAADVDLALIAEKTYSMSGAELADLLNEAAIYAARAGSEQITREHLHDGWLKVIAGTSRHRSMDMRERAIIASHEVGHAICGHVHGDRRRVEEITLFAHGNALGLTASSQTDNDLPSERDLRASLIALLGGRAAEELLFEDVTGGAGNDFEKANQLAWRMVSTWGMGVDPLEGRRGTTGRGSLSFLVANADYPLPPELAAAQHRAMAHILDESYEIAKKTLLEHLSLLRRISAYLVRHERMSGEVLYALLANEAPPAEEPDPNEEWRPDTARPRAWTDIPTYAAVGTLPPVTAVAAAAPAPVRTPVRRQPLLWVRLRRLLKIRR